MPYISVNDVDHYYEWVTQGRQKPLALRSPLWFSSMAGVARPAIGAAQQSSPERSLRLRFCMICAGSGALSSDQRNRAQVEARGYALETFADDLIALLDALGINQVDLNAHSMGGSVRFFY
jgi:pimeloyl-ACP methyl ester carboxylesterase